MFYIMKIIMEKPYKKHYVNHTYHRSIYHGRELSQLPRTVELAQDRLILLTRLRTSQHHRRRCWCWGCCSFVRPLHLHLLLCLQERHVRKSRGVWWCPSPGSCGENERNERNEKDGGRNERNCNLQMCFISCICICAAPNTGRRVCKHRYHPARDFEVG